MKGVLKLDLFSFFIGMAFGSVLCALIIKRKLKKAQELSMFQEQRRPKKPFNEVFIDEGGLDVDE